MTSPLSNATTSAARPSRARLSTSCAPRRHRGWGLFTLVAALAGATFLSPDRARAEFPDIPVWSYPGAYQGGADSVRQQSRTLTLRWMRDPAAEARPDFGGYRLYRVFNTPDTSRMVLLRRFSVQSSDSLFLWHFPPINSSTPDAQRIATFVDPDSSGSFQKVCRVRDEFGRCLSPGDSIFALIAPPGPHDGFRTWYSITYEGRHTISNDYLDLFLPDTVGCPFANRDSCPNLNHKARNLTSPEVEPTRGPVSDLERVTAVPNPYRATEAWDQPGGNEIHFVNLPSEARILIYTSAGDLVRELIHRSGDCPRCPDFERWDLKNASGRDVTSGIYVYRVESSSFSMQSRLVVIR
jgi:hypothetical protein